MTDNVRPDGAPLDGEPKVPASPQAPAESGKGPKGQEKTEPVTVKAAAASSNIGARCDSASETGPESLEEELADEEEEPMAGASAVQPRSKRSTSDIDWTEAGFEPLRKRRPLVWAIVLALGVVGLVLIFVMFPRPESPGAGPPLAAEQPEAAASSEAPRRPQLGGPNFPSPPASIPPARVQTAKSLSDLKIGNFAVNPRRPGDELTVISGDIENVSDNLHRGIRIELDLLDTQGLKVATAKEFVTELAARATWHVLARTTNARVVSARLTGIKEEP